MGFLNPAALIFSAFIAGLILLYLWERQQRRVDVPSMLLWQVVPEAVVRRHRFQPDFLFWLQLAALAALLLGLADPYLDLGGRDDAPRRAILVVDLSASMQTIENGASRLELARDEAVRVVHSAAAGTEMMIVGAAREPSIVAPFSGDRDALVDALAALRAKDLSTHLEPALAMARRLAFEAERSTAIHVFTDVPRDSIGARWRDGVNWWPAGSRADNLAIAAVQTTQGILQESRRVGARVSVRNYGTDEKHGSLAVRVAGEVVAQELFTAAPGSAQSFHYPALGSSGLLEATLQSEDALAVDNHWRTWLPPFRPIRIALVGATPDLAAAMARLAAATEAMSVATLPEGAAPAALAEADLAIFHRVTPERLPDTAALLIAPSRDVDTGRGLDDLHDVAVVDWSDTHEVLRGIEPRLLRRFDSVKMMTPPPWGEVVLTAQAAAAGGGEVPLLVLGRPGRRRAAILAADLASEPFLASDREPLLLLLANLIDWLAEHGDEVAVVRTGESKAVDDTAGPVTVVVDPRGDEIELRGATRFVDFDFAGIYRIRPVDGPESTILANFQDAEESDVGRRPAAQHIAPPAVPRPDQRPADAGLGDWLYGAAAMLLLGEWLAASRASDPSKRPWMT